MSEPLLPAELTELFSSLCDGSATAAQIHRLEELALADDAVCRMYLNYMALHGSLGANERGEGRMGEWATAAIADSPSLPIAPSPFRPLAHSSKLGFLAPITRRIPGGEATVGGLIVLVIAVAFWGLSQAIMYPNLGSHDLAEDSSPHPNVPPSHRHETVATITDTAAAIGLTAASTHGEESEIPNLKSQIAAGQPLSIQSGLVELQLNQGTKLIIQGPAEWTIDGNNTATLKHGKLVAKVPQQAIGFTLETPTTKIVDLGTEFGVEVDPQRGNNVLVFVGQVSVVSSNGPTVPTIVRAGESARLIAGESRLFVANSAVAGDNFVRAIKKPVKPRSLVQDFVLAHWRFENEAPSSETASTQIGVITDASGKHNELDYWPAGIGPYRSGLTVPPATMFAPGYDPGNRSFDSGALAPDQAGVLFHDSNRQGDVFTFPRDFTIEGYFQTQGDQSSAGPMTLLFKSRHVPQWEVVLNHPVPGALAIVLTGGGRETRCVVGGLGNPDGKQNLADGKWHYFAARAAPGDGKLSLTVGDEDGSSTARTAEIPPGFAFDPTSGQPESNLFVGRKTHIVSIQRHFIGSIDEVRISREALLDNQLLFPLPNRGAIQRQ